MAEDAKYGRVTVPGIPDNEPVFVLRAQDALAGAVLEQYRELRHSAGGVPDSLHVTIRRFHAWPTKRLPT